MLCNTQINWKLNKQVQVAIIRGREVKQVPVRRWSSCGLNTYSFSSSLFFLSVRLSRQNLTQPQHCASIQSYESSVLNTARAKVHEKTRCAICVFVFTRTHLWFIHFFISISHNLKVVPQHKNINSKWVVFVCVVEKHTMHAEYTCARKLRSVLPSHANVQCIWISA